MNRYTLISGLALILLIVLLPLYAMQEPARLAVAQNALREKQLREATVVYVNNCAICHGPGGGGSEAMPALNNPALAESDPAYLYTTVARAPHGSVMSAWHLAEGGILSDYQVDQLVTLIRYADWEVVGAAALASGVATPARPVSSAASEGNALIAARSLFATILPATAAEGTAVDPHQCAACHEEPAIHADRFGLDCVRCHGLEAWQPALLTRHTFRLDHGDEGEVPCQTCHQDNYYEHTCYGCHDHTPVQMGELHEKAEIYDYEACVSCHPTGQEDEGQVTVR